VRIGALPSSSADRSAMNWRGWSSPAGQTVQPESGADPLDAGVDALPESVSVVGTDEMPLVMIGIMPMPARRP